MYNLMLTKMTIQLYQISLIPSFLFVFFWLTGFYAYFYIHLVFALLSQHVSCIHLPNSCKFHTLGNKV